jgi:hypothetical protein
LAVDFYPEGGTLVAGVPNRVYFHARTSQGKPTDFHGHIVDQAGQVVVADVRTLHVDEEPDIDQGLGRFTIAPRQAERYKLISEGSAEASGEHELPAANPDGVALSLAGDAFKAKDPIPVVVRSAGKERKLQVSAQSRGLLLDQQTVTARPGEPTSIQLRAGSAPGGICRLTVSEADDTKEGAKQFIPVAERLFYLQPAEELQIALEPHVTGDKASLTIESRQNGQLCPSVVALTVVDSSRVQLSEEKLALAAPAQSLYASAGRIPKDLEHADVLLGPNPRAAIALDLLLGAQNWRGQSDALAKLSEKEVTARQELKQPDSADLAAASAPSESIRQLEETRAALQGKLDQLHTIAARVRPYALLGLGILVVLVLSVFLIPIVRAGLNRIRAGIAIAGALAVASLLCVVIWHVDEDRPSPVRYAEQRDEALALVTQAGVNSVKETDLAAKVVAPARNGPSEAFGRIDVKREKAAVAENGSVEQKKDGPARPAVANGALSAAGRGGAASGLGLGGGGDKITPSPLAPPALARQPTESRSDAKMRRAVPGFRVPMPMTANAGEKQAAENEQVPLKKTGGVDRSGLAAPEPAGTLRLEKAKQPSAPESGAAKPVGSARAFGLERGAASDKRAKAAPVKSSDGRGRQQPSGDAKAPLAASDFAYIIVPKTAGQAPTPPAAALYWNAALDLPAGNATVSFELPHSVSSFQIRADGHTPDGRLGTTTTITVTRGDKR